MAGTVLSFGLAWLVSLLLAGMAALSIVEFYHAGEEFIVIQMVIVVYSIVTIATFAVTYLRARTRRSFAIVAVTLAAVAIGIEEIPALAQAVVNRTSSPYKGGFEQDVEISIALLVPIFIIIVLQWQFALRRWLRASGQTMRSRWPWIATAVATIMIFSTAGLQVIHGTFFSGEQLTRNIAQFMLMIAAAVLAVIAVAEWWIRKRRAARMT